jgi:hypothetical protein
MKKKSRGNLKIFVLKAFKKGIRRGGKLKI